MKTSSALNDYFGILNFVEAGNENLKEWEKNLIAK